MQKFDVFIIGAGPAGITLANRCAQAGLHTGIADGRGFGGTCTLHGCDPKRIMVTRTSAIQAVDHLQEHGLEGVPQLNWQDTKKAVSDIIGPLPDIIRQDLQSSGAVTFTENARFTAPNRLLVGIEEIEAQHIVIAVGKSPAPLNIPGGAFAKTSDDSHHLPELPQRMLFVGGGYIGLESAHFAARAGRKVVVLNDNENPLPMFEPELVERFLACTRTLGINFQANTTVTEISELSGKGFRVSAKTKNGKELSFDCDLVMNTTGRTPNFDKLDLHKAHIEAQKDGLEVDEYFQVRGSERIYAIGDVAISPGAPLTPVASLEASCLAKTLQGEKTKANYDGVATVVYALPELATVGLLEEECKKQGLDYRVSARIDADEKFNAKRTRAGAYGYKILIDNESEEILGAHLIGPSASEVINLFALAIRANISSRLLKSMPFAYPTWGSDVTGML